MDKIKLILGSKSPRRQALVRELGFPYEVRIEEVEEVYPEYLSVRNVPEYLAKLKTEPLLENLNDSEVLITSDTVVILDGKLLGKPNNEEEAKQMLKMISGEMHEVVTGVCMSSLNKSISFSTTTQVFFSQLTVDEINFYVDKFKPLDKAGSYGIQEWIGYIGVKKIEGCYYNVMGLPLHQIYSRLKADFLF